MKSSNKVVSIMLSVLMVLTFFTPLATLDVLALGASSVQPFMMDISPPVIHSATLDKTVVDAPGIIKLTPNITDDISGVSYAGFLFENTTTGQYLSGHFYPKWDTYAEIEIAENEHEGLYELISINLMDIAGNSVSYYRNDYENTLPFTLSFTVNNPNQDITPPVIHSATLDKTVVDAPGIINITTNVTDDISGVSYAGFLFENTTTGQYLSGHFYPKWDTYAEIEIAENEHEGLYELISINLMDIAGNSVSYRSNDYENTLPFTLSFTVNNPNQDITPPVIHSATLDKTVVDAPGIINITTNVTDDISGVSYAGFLFENTTTGQYLSGHFYPKWDTYAEVEISTYQHAGRYELISIGLMDIAGNSVSYYRNDYENTLPFTLSFTVKNDFEYGLMTNTNNPNLTDDIKALPNGSNVGINYGTNPNVNSDLFDAIKGTDKTLILADDGIEWVFNGNDISNPKNINLKVEINLIDDIYNPEIAQILGDTPGVVLEFANNGQLPGKVLMRVKADYKLREYLKNGSLNVFYFNNQTSKLESIATNVTISSDNYIEFYLTHNSNFVITPSVFKGDDSENGNGSSNGYIGRVNSSSSTGGGTSKADTAPVISSGRAFTKVDATKLFSSVLANKQEGVTTLSIRARNYTSVDKTVLAELATLAEKSGVTLTVYFDTVVNKVVTSRISVNPATMQTNLDLTVKMVDSKITMSKLAIPVEIAVKLPAGMTMGSLKIIQNGNDVTESAKLWLDKNGYVHFTTTGGEIVLSK